MNVTEKKRGEISELMDTLRGNFDKVVQHGKRADAIVKNMLLHSREGSGEHRPVDINALVEEGLNLAYHGARAEKQGFNIKLEKSFDPNAGEADVFPQDITRVLLNLISNGFYAATRRNPDEFAIALEQVVAGTAPEDYRKPEQFFARTCFTRALARTRWDGAATAVGRTENTAPVLTLITQFGGGKTHTLTTLYHLATNGEAAMSYSGVADLVREAGINSVPKARVAVFVGNAWDPRDGRENPWIDIARQLGGDKGVEALGPAAKTTPPGTEAIANVFAAAGGPVLLLFDEVLNFLNRHRGMADSFHAFIQNLTVATTGTTHGACVISLPRSAGGDDGMGSGVAGQDLEGGTSRRQGSDRQRRNRDQ